MLTMRVFIGAQHLPWWTSNGSPGAAVNADLSSRSDRVVLLLEGGGEPAALTSVARL